MHSLLPSFRFIGGRSGAPLRARCGDVVSCNCEMRGGKGLNLPTPEMTPSKRPSSSTCRLRLGVARSRTQPVRRQFPRVGCVTATRPSHNLDRLFDALSEEVDVKYALTTVVVVHPECFRLNLSLD